MKFSSSENAFISEISNILRRDGLLYGEELKDYILDCAKLGSMILNIRNYENIEDEILRRIDKKLNKKDNDKPKGKTVKQPPKPVIQINAKNNIIIDRFDSVYKASKSTGVATSSICKCCKGEQEQTKGFKFKYVE